MLDRVLATIESRKHQSLSLLKEFLSVPSVSTKPEHKADMQRCAMWVADQCRFAALETAVMQTPGHPIVVAKNKHQPNRPTILFYGHYDVQPPEPLDQWESPPFEPTIRNGAIYARGAVDDKGQVWAHIEALLAWQAHGGPPVNVTLLIEGEEEIGSDHLEAFVKFHQESLRADICVISDTNQFARGLPAITYGLRGIVYEQITVTGSRADLHSGLYGGAVMNPANALVSVLSSLHREDGGVNIPGFYDAVREVSAEERAEWASLPHDDLALCEDIGAADVFGEAGFTTLERVWARPTCDINGLTAGYQGPGAKTIIPSSASAKVSMRLVPDQDPAKVRAAFEQAIRERLHKTMKITFQNFGSSAPVVVKATGNAVSLGSRALEIGFGTKPVLVRSGGIIGAVDIINRILRLDSLMIGFGLPDDRVHAPNEKFELESFHSGCRTACAIYGLLAELK